MTNFLSLWHKSIEDKIVDSTMMDDEVEFRSPLVYKPIIGIEMVTKYLIAANDVLNTSNFRYRTGPPGHRFWILGHPT